MILAFEVSVLLIFTSYRIEDFHSRQQCLLKNLYFLLSPHQHHRKYANPTICNKIIIGMPYLNFRCNVLCLNAIIPHNAPRLPPIIANPSRVRSGTLRQCFMAQYLSHPYNRNVPILIITKYLMNSCTIFPSCLLAYSQF